MKLDELKAQKAALEVEAKNTATHIAKVQADISKMESDSTQELARHQAVGAGVGIQQYCPCCSLSGYGCVTLSVASVEWGAVRGDPARAFYHCHCGHEIEVTYRQ